MTQNTAPSSPAFPKLIQLPSVDRPVRVPVESLAAVASAADLPSRMPLGDLVAESFRREKKGWSAEWRDVDGHRVKLRCAGHLSSLEMSFAGDEAVTLTSAERFSDLGQSIQGIHPGAWLDKLAGRLEGVFNLRVLQPREEDTVLGEFPDGHRLSLIVPVPADRLMALYDLFKALQSDPSIHTGVDAYVRLHFSVVNYLEGRNHPMLAHPVGLVLHHVNALGAPAAEMPVREVDIDGVAAWTLQRSHYLCLIHCHLREVERLVARLAAAGFVGAAGGREEGWPHGAEFGAALMPFGYEYVARNAWWFDKERHRRMFYPTFADPDDRSALTGRSGEIWLKALIRDALKAAEFTRADTARAFAEGMAMPHRGDEAGAGRPLH